MHWRIIIILLCIAITSGCAHTENVQVSAIAANQLPENYQRFVIVTNQFRSNDSDLQFTEYARQVALVLSQLGYVQAEKSEEAQLLVSLSYQIGEPQVRTEILNTPTYPMINPYYGFRAGRYPHPVMLGYPAYEPMFYQSVIYNKMIRLQAIDAAAYAKNKTVKPLWDVLAVSANDNGDLRYMFPYMLVAARPYIGKNSGHSVRVSVAEDAPGVFQLRGIR